MTKQEIFAQIGKLALDNEWHTVQLQRNQQELNKLKAQLKELKEDDKGKQ